MDNLYDDLENYDDVNIVEELKKENAELKLKLEDYAKVMDKLQKDFNKVTTEFKNLEINYSSLLKTARAEIERKTNIINTLNIEKDMMVLNSIQNGNRRILNLRKNVPQKICAEDKISLPSSSSKKSITADERRTKKIESESNVENRLPSEEIIPSPSPPNSDVKYYKNPKTNCGHKDIDEKPGKYLAQQRCEKGFRSRNIKNRRNSEVKSKIFPKFSSDDGSENDSSDEKIKRHSPIRDRSHNNIGHEKRHSVRNRPSEKTLSTHEIYDERKSMYYKNRGNMYVEDYRNRDKFKPNSRHRRRISPDRHSNRRGDRDHYDDRVHKPEYNNERISLSPPFGGKRKSREPRSNYQKEHSEKKRESYQERHTTKHKIPADRDEPPTKRCKTTFHCNQNNEVLERSHFVSCESPDDSAVDNVAPETPIKEIMNTAAMHLEDPRLTSDKYILATDTDKVELSTVIGRNVEFKTIDKATWGYPSLPELLQRPRENSEEFLKNIYMDIYNRPTLNLSLESGEVLDPETNDDVTKVTLNNNVSDKQEEPLEVIPNVENFRMSNFSEYKIPKPNVTRINSDESKSSCITNPKSTNILEIPNSNADAQNRIEKTFYEKQINDEQPQEFLKHSEQQKKIMPSEEMVQEDLELTDEDEDSGTISKKIKENKKERKDKEKKSKKSKKRIKEINTNNSCTLVGQKNDLKDSKITSSENVESKFSDLFGDSNSLITPEDLQLHSNQPRIQNTVGLLANFEEELNENKSLKYISSSTDNVNSKSMLIIRREHVDYEENISCNQTMTDTGRQLDTTIEKLNEVKSILNETSLIQSTSEIKLSSMDIDNEQSIVKSVIISTGFQTQFGSTQLDPVETYTENNETDNTSTKKSTVKVQESLIKALATSTPHKEIPQDPMSNVELKRNCDSNVNDSIITSDSHSTLVEELSNAKISDTQNNGDEPDIRVFARRRRRIIKKSM